MSMPNPYGLPEVAAILATDANANPVVFAYTNGHLGARGIFGGGTQPVLAAGAGAGAGASISAQLGFDIGGSFNLLTAGSPAAGVLATVTFGAALNAAPAMVMLNCWDITGAAAVAVGPTSITTTGFSVSTGATATTAHHLLISYAVLLQQQ